MVKKLWRYVKPFLSDTGTLRTDRRTDGQICYIKTVLEMTVAGLDRQRGDDATDAQKLEWRRDPA